MHLESPLYPTDFLAPVPLLEHSWSFQMRAPMSIAVQPRNESRVSPPTTGGGEHVDAVCLSPSLDRLAIPEGDSHVVVAWTFVDPEEQGTPFLDSFVHIDEGPGPLASVPLILGPIHESNP